MNDNVKLKKSVFGGYTLHYSCSRCASELKSPLSDAGKSDTCPDCGTKFVVPGVEQRQSLEQARKAEQELKKKAKDEKERNAKLQAEIKQKQAESRQQAESRRQQAEEAARLTRQERSEEPSSRSCPYCGESILAVAIKCKHCGEMLDNEAPKSQSPSKIDFFATSNKSNAASSSALGGCLVLILMFGGCLVFISSGSNSSDNSDGTSAASSSPDEVSAWVMAQQFVTDKLKAPSTASFGGVFSGDYQDPRSAVTDLGGDKFRVIAWVDSQNGFGAMIRNQFICELEYVGNDRWRCTSLLFDE